LLENVPKLGDFGVGLFAVDFIQQSQDGLVFRDVAHRLAVMLVADLTGFVHHQQRGDAPQFENVPLLAVKVGNLMFGVRQADDGNVTFLPITAEGFGVIGADGKDCRVTRGEGRIIIAQVREMGAAIGSHKPAQED